MSMTEIPTIESTSIPQTNISEGLKVEANQPLIEAENPVNTPAEIKGNTVLTGRDDLPKAEIKIVGTDTPVSVGFMTFEDANDDRISILKRKIINEPIAA